VPRRPDQKEWIQRQAALLWAERGYHGTGVQELCEATGLGRGALYYHIGTKDELLYEISIGSVVRMVGEAEEIMALDLSCSERLRLLSESLMANIAERLPEWVVFFHELGSLRGAKRDEVMAQRDRYEALWLQLAVEGQNSGEFRKVDPLIVKGMLGMHNYAYVWIRQSGQKTPEEISHIFSDVLLRGLVSDPTP
jgi:AcrR family transcriptional regulator